MKKYFCTETDELVDFGDKLHLVFCKNTEDGKVTVEKDVEFNDLTMDALVEMGFVEEREVEEGNNDLLDFDDEQCEALSELIEDVERLKDQTSSLIKMHNDFVKLMTNMLDTFKEFAISQKDKEIQPKNE